MLVCPVNTCGTMQDRKDITVPIPGELDAAIESELEYGDHKSEWVREAIRQRLDAEPADADSKEIEDIMDAVKNHNSHHSEGDADDAPAMGELPEPPEVGDVVDHPTMGRVRVAEVDGHEITVEPLEDGPDGEPVTIGGSE